MSTDKPWGGRFSGATDDFVEAFTASVHFDSRLGEIDALCSQAHAKTLLNAGILTNDEYEQIVAGLDTIIGEIQTGKTQWNPKLEDVHMNIEARLTDLIGEPGRKLHTARSRNDQVASSFKLYLLKCSETLAQHLQQAQQTLLDKAALHTETIMPGFTHLQIAQPVTFGHHLMAWFEMLERDDARLRDWRKRTNISPMGSAALAGTSYPIDRTIFQKSLGFDSISRNSLDAVSDRDYALELLSNLSFIMVHLSRICEEVIIWNSTPFSLVDLPDALCTGSSIMPQKKNPDVAELVRGKSGRVFGHLSGLLTLMKGQPLAYNRDNQEDKETVFDAMDTTIDCVQAVALLINGLEPNAERMLTLAAEGHPTATDMADWLVRRGVPFRDAHSTSGRAVALADTRKIQLHELTLTDLNELSDVFDETVFECLTLRGSVDSRNHVGGTAPATVKAAIEAAKTRLTSR